MAHDTVERFSKWITQTPADVGPGSYDIADLSCPKRHLAEFHPFLSGAKRQTLTVSKYAQEVPGPGTYCIKDPQRHIPERVSIDFTDSRFKEKGYLGPGPAEYDVKADALDCHKQRPHPGTWRGPAGKLYLARPPRSVLPASVSVPDKHHTGYHIDDYGVFTKNPPVEHEPTFLYNVPREETNMTTLLYKGNFWSRMTGRSGPRLGLTPGPGDYDVETTKTATELQNEKIREAKRMSSRQLRFLDVMYRRLFRENLPAPNSYRVKGTFDRFIKNSCKCDPYVLEPPPFGHTAKRFDDKVHSDTPGPGSYYLKDQTRCIASNYLAPFGTYAPRFKKGIESDEPSPCDYHTNVGNLAYESKKRFKYSYLQPQRHISFDQFFTFEDETDDYVTHFVEKNEVKKRAVYHAAFKSRTKRFPKSEKVDVPDPGAYEALKAFKAIRDPCDVIRRRAPFGSRVSRMARTQRDNRPDPTSYHLAGDISVNVKGGVMSLPSSLGHTKPGPGPTNYCIHPYLSSSILKKSFNVKLGKPKVIQEMMKLEKSARKPRCPCARKRLRWFTVTSKEYDHCQIVHT